jgi:anti-sigma-K factor RskA
VTPYTHEELRTLASAHALDALDAADADAVQEHLATCAECRAVFDDALEAAAALALAAPSAHPPAALRDRIVAAARAERPAEAEAEAAPAPVADLAAARARRRRRLFTPARGLAAAFAVAAVAAAVFAVSADRRANRLQDERDQLAALTHGDASVVALRSGKTPTGASVVVPREGTPVLVSSLSSAPGDRVYQVWAIAPTGGAPVSLGLLRGGGQALLKIDRTLPAGTTVAITVEPGGGSKAPTSAPIAAAAVE